MRDSLPRKFDPPFVEALGFYVYRLLDPRTGETFYLGKGSGDRVLQHTRAALLRADPSDRLDRIRAIHAAGLQVDVVIHRHGMPEAVVLEVEAALIDAYRERGLTNIVSGHGTSFGIDTLEELMTRYAAVEAAIPVAAIIIKIEREWLPSLTPERLYERTRRYWKCNSELRRLPPTHALAVARGIIREVYKIERWERYTRWPEDRDPTRLVGYDLWPEGHVRRGFIGKADLTLSKILVNCSVRHLTSTGSQNPITYINC